MVGACCTHRREIHAGFWSRRTWRMHHPWKAWVLMRWHYWPGSYDISLESTSWTDLPGTGTSLKLCSTWWQLSRPQSIEDRELISWLAGYNWNMVKDVPCDPICKNTHTLRRTRPQYITRSTIIIILKRHSDGMKYHERITVYCTLCKRYGIRK